MISRLTSILLWLATAAAAHAQQTVSPAANTPVAPPPGADQMTGQLMFFTLGAGLLIAIVMLLYFLHRRSNRAAAERVFAPKNRDTL